MASEKVNILYVDDEAHNLATFVAAFRRYYNIFTATSAEEALTVLRQQQITVVITDQRMPDKTGVDLLKLIILEFPGVVRFLLTGFSDESAIIEAINEAQIFRYITKPWDEQALKLNIDMGVKFYQLEQHKHEIIRNMKEESNKLDCILNLFEKYVPARVIENTLSNGKNLFRGEMRHVAILLVKLHNASTLVEEKQPEQVLEYLNHFFSMIVSCLTVHKGTFDKFIGPSLLALFGAPISLMDAEHEAVFCALSILNKLDRFNEQYCEQFDFEARVGIAVHAGEVVVGNLGSADAISYTAIGDVMNTAARVFELTDAYPPNTLLITDAVYEFVKKIINVEKLGAQSIRGKEKTLELYKVSGSKED